jgi:NitT/TauT family transport system substrate-binding protein
MRLYHLATLCLVAGFSAPSSAADSVTFGTNWLAQAEQGGFFQAVADGTYARYGLDVKIVPGGPQTSNRLLLAAGKLDFYMDANLISLFAATEQKVPTIGVAAIFQKAPIIFMSHPGVGLDRFEDLKDATAFVGRENLATDFRWLKQAHGFSEEKVKPYTYNPQPFIADVHSIQQGYLTSEPFQIEKQAGFRPNIFLLADYGFNSYSTLIETRRDLVETNPDLVQRFVDASLLGWRHYLDGDTAAANALIKQANPDMTDEQIAFSVAKLRDYGIVDSGEALTLGIGAMTDARIGSFFEKMAAAKVVRGDLDYRSSYTLRFVNKGVGVGQGH